MLIWSSYNVPIATYTWWKEGGEPIKWRIGSTDISCDGKKYLGTPLCTALFVHSLIQQPGRKNLNYCLALQSHNPMLLMLSLHGFTSKWTYLTKVVPDVSDLFAPLEAIIRQIFLPSLTGQSSLSDELMALPVRLASSTQQNSLQMPPST